MRLWSLHPCYLDTRGLVALWREGLLARAVLEEKTRGYRHHPQVERFRHCVDPIAAINRYLRSVYEEAEKRGFRFDPGKLGRECGCAPIVVSEGQLQYEIDHLKRKLKMRDAACYETIKGVKRPKPHPLFIVAAGGVENWEKRVDRQQTEEKGPSS